MEKEMMDERRDPLILYGRHPVLEGLKAEKTFEKIVIIQSRHPTESLFRIRRTAEASGIPVIFAPHEKLDALAGNRDHQGVVGILSAYDYAGLDEILEKRATPKIVVILDHLEDPQNLGSLIRTCDAVGVSGVIVPKRRAAGLTGGAAKASAGAIQHVPVARVPNLHHTLLQLRERGFTLIGADQSASDDFRHATYQFPLALVLGNEHKGLSLLLKNTCDRLVKIPMRGHLDSLNVSVSGALILYQIALQS